MRATILAILLIVGCTSGEVAEVTSARLDAAGAVLPDTQTVEGVLELHHSAAALAQVAEWDLDTMPERIYDDPTGEVDLSMVSHAVAFSDGRMLLTGVARMPGLVLWGPDGLPERVLARRGEGPGELNTIVWRNVFVVRDTAHVFDPYRKRISRYTSDGFASDTTWDGPLGIHCGYPDGYLAAQRRFLFACGDGGIDDSSARPIRRIGIGAVGSDRIIAEIPGNERRRRVTETTVGMRQMWGPLTLGRTTQVVAWDSVVVVATQAQGYRLELLDTAGVVRRAIVLDVPAVPVTQATRDAEITKAVEWARRDDGHGGYSPGELERQAREQPIADTLPPHGELFVASDGILWVMTPATWADTAWSALGFRHDGAIVGRLSGRGDRTRRPIWFGPGRVMTRIVDEDGVVRVGVYQLRSEL
jgi:hypothetical protein